MKRLPVLIFALCLIFCSCERPFGSPPSPLRAFSSVVELRYGEDAYTADFACYSHADMRLTFTAPDTLAGFSVRYTPEGYRCDILGTEDVIPEDIILEDSCVKLFFDSVREALFTVNELCRKADGNYAAVLSGGKYEAIYGKDGAPEHIIASDGDFSASFREHQY